MVELKSGEKKGAFDIYSDGEKVGVLEYESFWDKMPYLSLLKLEEEYRGRGIGAKALSLLEAALREKGFKALLTSTQSDERAQNFYRRLGYSECGCLILENSPFKQAMEMFFMKTL